jgi:hypothetical protein
MPKLPKGHVRATYVWYNTWARSRQAWAFMDTDWQRLHQVAWLVDELNDPKYDLDGKRTSPAVSALMAEIRQNEAKLGATVQDRSSIYMRVQRATNASEDEAELAPVEDTQGPVEPPAGRQDRLRIVDQTG